MPRYKKKQTRLMEYDEFKEAIKELPINERAFLSVLFFAGVRVSEALALTPNDINCAKDLIYVDFVRLKGSKQTDPIPLPRNDDLNWLCMKTASFEFGDQRFFPFSRKTAGRLIKRVFPDLYPHYFRMNRVTKVSEKYGDSYVYSFFGISAGSIDHYRGKVDIKRVGKALKDEVSNQ